MDLVGRKLGRYTVLDALGRGAMASVFKARDDSDASLVALKLLPGHITRDPGHLRRFKREYRILAELDHPNIIRIIDFQEADGLHFYTMQYLDHPTLRAVIRRHRTEEGGPLPVPRAVRILQSLLRGLEYIHGRKVVHRDVKPANCYVLPGDETVLADFGLVKASQMTAITMAPSFIGTPEYASPEQIMVDQPVDPRSDVYQAGLMLYEMVAGALPFGDDLEGIISQKIMEDTLRSPREYNPAISEELDAVILQATARDPDVRFPTSRDMRAALAAARL